jgi:hypothetical protein
MRAHMPHLRGEMQADDFNGCIKGLRTGCVMYVFLKVKGCF